MTPKLKKIILLLIIAIALFVVYAVFIKKGPEVDPLINNGAGAISGDAQVIGNQISQALLRIEQIKLDKAIFTNNLYRSLVDRSEPISEEPIGRSNPFAPIGGVSSVNSTTRNASSTVPAVKSATSTPQTTASTTPSW
ncbi:MAG: hypothetical protein RLZZ517_553 [Candidatus Parcubacteria bacterium]|jgi:hypothetical protein